MNVNKIEEGNVASSMVGVDDTSEKRQLSYVARGWKAKIKEINMKYRKPRLQMTPMVRAALLGLRLYLIILVFILLYKFYTLVR
jgi:hypothetical protein